MRPTLSQMLNNRNFDTIILWNTGSVTLMGLNVLNFMIVIENLAVIQNTFMCHIKNEDTDNIQSKSIDQAL